MNKLLTIMFFCFIAGIGMLNLIVEDRVFSEHENRNLTQKPTFSFNSFITGEFMREFEEYTNDQFVAKKFWVTLKANAEKLMIKKDNNGIYWGKNDFLFSVTNEPVDQFEKNIQHILTFAKRLTDIQTYVLLAPTSVEMYKENLPLFVESFSQKEMLSYIKDKLEPSVSIIDVFEILSSKKNEDIYFRTDHHWTMRGAFYAYQKAAISLGLTPFELSDFDKSIVSEKFLGTFQSKTNDYFITPDQIEVFKPKFEITYEVHYNDGKDSTETLFEPNYLNKKDQYSYFLNGNHSLLKITSSINNNRKLAIIKDSYANAFIPFLANHFEEIHVIDLRYYPLGVYDYMEINNIKEALFLYNIDNFSKDTNLLWLQK